VPKIKNASASPSSEKSSREPIFLPHLRHFPFSISHEMMGKLSYHLSLVLQLRQIERLGSLGFVCVGFWRDLGASASACSFKRSRRA